MNDKVYHYDTWFSKNKHHVCVHKGSRRKTLLANGFTESPQTYIKSLHGSPIECAKTYMNKLKDAYNYTSLTVVLLGCKNMDKEYGYKVFFKEVINERDHKQQ